MTIIYHTTYRMSRDNTDEKLEPLNSSNAIDTCWAYVLSDSSKVFEIKCVFKGNTYHILDNQEINDLFGGER